jgi:ribonuclease Z
MIDALLLGTGAMMPLPDRWLSSALARIGGELILFDCGEGTQIPLQQHGWGFRRLSMICLTHMHADHVSGLPGMLHAIANAGREEPVRIVGPVGTQAVVASLRIIAWPLPYAIEIEEREGGERFEIAEGVTGSLHSGDHRIPCLAFRIDVARGRQFQVEAAERAGIPMEHWRRLQQGHDVDIDGGRVRADDFLGPERRGVSIAFVTDTRPVQGLPAFLNDVDLLICEATYGDPADALKAVERKHMTFAEAATLARGSRARRLWLTHFSPAVTEPLSYRSEAARIFPDAVVGFSGLQETLAFEDEDI